MKATNGARPGPAPLEIRALYKYFTFMFSLINTSNSARIVFSRTFYLWCRCLHVQSSDGCCVQSHDKCGFCKSRTHSNKILPSRSRLLESELVHCPIMRSAVGFCNDINNWFNSLDPTHKNVFGEPSSFQTYGYETSSERTLCAPFLCFIQVIF